MFAWVLCCCVCGCLQRQIVYSNIIACNTKKEFAIIDCMPLESVQETVAHFTGPSRPITDVQQVEVVVMNKKNFKNTNMDTLNKNVEFAVSG